MTKEGGWLVSLADVAGRGELQISPPRSPGIPVELSGAYEDRIRGACEFSVVGIPGTLRSR